MKKLVLGLVAVLVIVSIGLVSFGCAKEAPAPGPAPTKTIEKTVEKTITATPAPAPTVTVKPAPAPTVTVAPAPTKPAAPIRLIFSSCWGAQNIGTQCAVGWCDYVTAMTNGRVTFDFYFDGALAAGKEHMAAFTTGLADCGPFASAYTPAEFPLNTLWELPYAAQNADTMSEVAPLVYAEFPEYIEDYTRNNMQKTLPAGNSGCPGKSVRSSRRWEECR